MKLLDREDEERYDRLDNINALASNLRKLLNERQEKLVLVVTNADQQRGATPTLLPALARLGDLVSNTTTGGIISDNCRFRVSHSYLRRRYLDLCSSTSQESHTSISHPTNATRPFKSCCEIHHLCCRILSPPTHRHPSQRRLSATSSPNSQQ